MKEFDYNQNQKVNQKQSNENIDCYQVIISSQAIDKHVMID